MSAEANKEVIRRFIEEVNAKGREAAAEDYLDPRFVDHGIPDPRLRGPDGWRTMRAPFFGAFGPMRIEIEDMLAEGDRVAVRFRLVATHSGSFLGLPPSGKEVVMTGTDINRLEAGKIVERWGNEDLLGLLQQVGAIPAPAPA